MKSIEELRSAEDITRKALNEVVSADPEAVKRVINYLDNLDYDNINTEEDLVSIDSELKTLLLHVSASQTDRIEEKFLNVSKAHKGSGLSAKKSFKIHEQNICMAAIMTGMNPKRMRKLAKKCVEEVYGTSLKKKGKKRKKRK